MATAFPSCRAGSVAGQRSTTRPTVLRTRPAAEEEGTVRLRCSPTKPDHSMPANTDVDERGEGRRIARTTSGTAPKPERSVFRSRCALWTFLPTCGFRGLPFGSHCYVRKYRWPCHVVRLLDVLFVRASSRKLPPRLLGIRTGISFTLLGPTCGFLCANAFRLRRFHRTRIAQSVAAINPTETPPLSNISKGKRCGTTGVATVAKRFICRMTCMIKFSSFK